MTQAKQHGGSGQGSSVAVILMAESVRFLTDWLDLGKVFLFLRITANFTEKTKPQLRPCLLMAVKVQDSFSPCSGLASPVIPSGGRRTELRMLPITRRYLLRVHPLSGTDLLQGPPPSPRVLSPLSRLTTFQSPYLCPPSLLPDDPYSALSLQAWLPPQVPCRPPSPLGLLPRMVWLLLVSTSSGSLWSLALVPTIHITGPSKLCALRSQEPRHKLLRPPTPHPPPTLQEAITLADKVHHRGKSKRTMFELF